MEKEKEDLRLQSSTTFLLSKRVEIIKYGIRDERSTMVIVKEIQAGGSYAVRPTYTVETG